MRNGYEVIASISPRVSFPIHRDAKLLKRVSKENIKGKNKKVIRIGRVPPEDGTGLKVTEEASNLRTCQCMMPPPPRRMGGNVKGDGLALRQRRVSSSSVARNPYPVGLKCG